MTTKRTYAMLFQAETEYGTRSVGAYLAYTEDGKIRNHVSSSSRWSDPDYVRGDFKVHAYLGNSTRTPDPDPGQIWGCSIFMTPHRMNLTYAEDATKLLRRVTNGMTKLEQTDGYVQSADFFGWSMRVARILGIKTFYVRATDSRARELNGGNLFRETSGAGVQSWLSQVSHEAKQGTLQFR